MKIWLCSTIILNQDSSLRCHPLWLHTSYCVCVCARVCMRGRVRSRRSELLHTGASWAGWGIWPGWIPGCLPGELFWACPSGKRPLGLIQDRAGKTISHFSAGLEELVLQEEPGESGLWAPLLKLLPLQHSQIIFIPMVIAKEDLTPLALVVTYPSSFHMY